MDFLQIEGKRFLVMGVANRKSVAFHIGSTLQSCGAQVIYSVRSEERRKQLGPLLGEDNLYVCDVENEKEITQLAANIRAAGPPLDGVVHSIAFADYSEGMRPFHETTKSQFLQAVDISCYSLVSVCNALKEHLHPEASVVALSISTTRMASENYGFMAPIKAALDSTVVFLAKSFSNFSRIRFNAVAPGLLKTSASAGIPGYVDSYLFAEQVIPRKKALQTAEAANVAAFLLSPRSSGINAQSLVVDAGMSINYFDRNIVANAMR